MTLPLHRVLLVLAISCLGAGPAYSARDAFGVNRLYTSADGGKEWTSNWSNGVARSFDWGDDPEDPWFHGKGDASYRVDGQGQLIVSGAVPRLYIYDPSRARGWRGVEMTVYAKRVSDSGTPYGGIVGMARTNHTADQTDPCDTRGIGARFRYDGHIDFEKETSHPNSVPAQNKTQFPGGLPFQQWIGYKLVVYDLPNGNVKLENYLDLSDGANGGDWVKVNELEDTGSNFGVEGVACKKGVKSAMALTESDRRRGSESGNPNLAVYFRSDGVGVDGLIYKKMSVREITSTPADETAPVIGGISVAAPGENSAVISWNTDEAAVGEVEYGTTSSYGAATATESEPNTAHAATLSGLLPGTLYHYRVRARDAAGNSAASADASFTTASAAPPPPPPSSTRDAFGVSRLYPSAPGGKEWISSWSNGVARTFGWGDDPKDPWLHGRGDAVYRVDGQGQLLISGAVPRLYIYDPALTAQWRGVEMTVYAKRVSDSGTAYGGIVGVARTNHTADTTNRCDTRGTGARFRYDGHIDFEKETSHPNSVPVQNKTKFPGGFPFNQWIGYKLIVYDLPNGNVKLENYMDLSDGADGGDWVLVNELEDDGANFGVGGVPCKSGIDPALRLTESDAREGSETGKPNLAVYFRSDNVGTDGLIYKKMSVREVAQTAPSAPDATAPVIAAVAVSAIGSEMATVSWTTDEPADGVVAYGVTASYGSVTALSAAPTTAHTATLVGLSPGTLYHYRVSSRDAAGNAADSPDGVFTTAPVSACVSSAGSWRNAPIAPQNGSFTVEFDASPSAAGIDGVAGLSLGAASAYAHLAAAVRFNNSGRIDARNGGVYSADSIIPYAAGASYHFRLVVDIASHRYSVFVRTGASPEETVGTNFAFRTEQSGVSGLDSLGLFASGGAETVCGLALGTGVPPPAFYDDFSSYSPNACVPEGSRFGAWTSVFDGFGCNSVTGDGTAFWMEEKPIASLSQFETHASLVTGPAFTTPLRFVLGVKTIAQLRTNSPPNPWETAWVVWGYTDNDHFYYFAPKPNGWELGKRDPSYPGGQRFLATGSSPAYPVGSLAAVEIEQTENVLSVTVDGRRLTEFTDNERPYLSGSIGLYNEDAQVGFGPVSVWGTPAVPAGGPAASPPAAATPSSAKAPQKFLSPGLADGVNDAAVFGSGASEVSIYGVDGRLVFHRRQEGASPITWDCRDGSGRVHESGLYIAKIRQRDSGFVYQSFAIVK